MSVDDQRSTSTATGFAIGTTSANLTIDTVVAVPTASAKPSGKNSRNAFEAGELRIVDVMPVDSSRNRTMPCMFAVAGQRASGDATTEVTISVSVPRNLMVW